MRRRLPAVRAAQTSRRRRPLSTWVQTLVPQVYSIDTQSAPPIRPSAAPCQVTVLDRAGADHAQHVARALLPRVHAHVALLRRCFRTRSRVARHAVETAPFASARVLSVDSNAIADAIGIAARAAGRARRAVGRPHGGAVV